MSDQPISLRLTLRIPAPHLSVEEYHDRAEQVMVALLNAEAANPGLITDSGVASQAGPQRLVDVECTVHLDNGCVWTQVPGLPGCFAAGQTIDELREALAESVRMYFTEGGTNE